MQKSDFQMNTPVLRNLIFKVNDDFVPSGSPLQIVISDAKDIIRNGENSATVSYSVRVFEEELKAEVPFFIEVSYSAVFKWSDLGEDEIVDLLNHNAPAILLGYIRPLVAQLSGNAGFPPLHLPLLNLQQNE